MKVHGGAGSKIVTEMKAKLESGQERIAGWREGKLGKM
jgi:hypothetical protein